MCCLSSLSFEMFCFFIVAPHEHEPCQSVPNAETLSAEPDARTSEFSSDMSRLRHRDANDLVCDVVAIRWGHVIALGQRLLEVRSLARATGVQSGSCAIVRHEIRAERVQS
jgi:hypothetical protein